MARGVCTCDWGEGSMERGVLTWLERLLDIVGRGRGVVKWQVLLSFSPSLP